MQTNSIQNNFLKHYQPIHEAFTRYCSSKVFGIMSTEDLMQEAILIALKGYDRIKDKDKLLGYLIGIVNNLVSNLKRRQKFQGDWKESQLDYLEDNISDPGLILDIQYLHTCIKRLPQLQQEALILFELCGLSIQEIAEIQQANEGTVKTRIHRARKKLKKQFEDQAVQKPLKQSMAVYFSIFL
ncbi:MAG: RNA polymerase sigma factor [Bacteroidota bacterium]